MFERGPHKQPDVASVIEFEVFTAAAPSPNLEPLLRAIVGVLAPGQHREMVRALGWKEREDGRDDA